MSHSVYSHLHDDSGGSSSELQANVHQQRQDNNNDGNFSVRSSLRSIGLSTNKKNRVPEALKEPLKSQVSNDEENDPYYVFREDLYRKLDLVEEALQEYQRLSKQVRHLLCFSCHNDQDLRFYSCRSFLCLVIITYLSL